MSGKKRHGANLFGFGQQLELFSNTKKDAPRPSEEFQIPDYGQFAFDALKKVNNNLKQRVEAVDARRPDVTDDKSRIIEATMSAERLAGEREMLERVAEALGLPRPE